MESHDVAKFAGELNWCINQLELGLQRQSPDSRQAQETFKIIKILRSTKAPLVKKRQAMRNALGDYRKKMKDEEKKSLNAMKQSRFKSTDNMKVYRKSKFLRRSHKSEIVYEKQNEFNEALNMNMNNLNLKQWSPLEYTNSPILPGSFPHESSTIINTDQCHISSPNGFTNPSSDIQVPVLRSDMLNGTSNSNDKLSSCNFKLCPSDNSFMFDFGAENCDALDDDVVNSEASVNNLDDDKCSSGANVSQTERFKFDKSDNSFSFNFGL